MNKEVANKIRPENHTVSRSQNSMTIKLMSIPSLGKHNLEVLRQHKLAFSAKVIHQYYAKTEKTSSNNRTKLDTI